MTAMTNDFRLHHYGILVENIEECTRQYVENFGYHVRSETFHDPIQAARVRFLSLPGESVYLELVSPDGPESQLQNALRRSPGLHHLCFSTPRLDEGLRHMSDHGAMLVRAPAPAVAFRQQKIAWVMDRNFMLVELVERGSNGELDFPGSTAP
jgi:methylmalonyl-CoA/ethylmalonyl-CoA epimerase